MKKIILLITIVVSCFSLSYFKETSETSSSKIEVTYDYTVDGDTVYFIENGERYKYRLLLIDTPEDTSTIEPYGPEATAFTKSMLENGKIIEIEYQEDNEIVDKYERKLVWVFVDGKLLQEELARAGLVEKFYDNGGNFTYKVQITQALNEAKENKVGLYEE